MATVETTRALGARFFQAFEVELVESMAAASAGAGSDAESVDFKAMAHREVMGCMETATRQAGVYPPSWPRPVPTGAVKLEGPEAGHVVGAVVAILDGARVIEFRDPVDASTGGVAAGLACVRYGRDVPEPRRFYIVPSLLEVSLIARLVLLGLRRSLDAMATRDPMARRGAIVAAELEAAAAMISAGVRPLGQDGPVLIGEGGAA